MMQMLPQGTSLQQGGGQPPLDLTNVAPDDLRRLCTSMYDDLHFLSGLVPERFGPAVSTCVTAFAAGTAGLIDGYLGDKANIGPIDINTAVALAAAGGAVFLGSANEREGAAAVARGFGAPLIYGWAQMKGKVWKASQAQQQQPAAQPQQ